MNNEEILDGIAYLEADLGGPSAADCLSGDVINFLRDVVQIEMAKQGHLREAEDVSVRIASLERRMEIMRRELVRQRGTPSVVYVRRGAIVAPTTALDQLHGDSRRSLPPSAGSKLPAAMIAFYGLGLGCSLVFAALLALSAMKIDTIHPFISLLGLVGGLGWLTTAWTDLLLWKRENLSANEFTEKERPIPASSAR